MQPREDRDLAYLDDIREACALITDRLKNKLLPDFVSDRGLQDSIAMRLLIIGEASKNLTESTKKRYSKIKWKDMGRLRDLIVHHYWSVDTIKVWEIAQEDIPQLTELLSD